MNNQKTIKALEELAKSEFATADALDAARTEAQDEKIRKTYRKWRDSHLRQAEALNARIEDLGGQPVPYEFGDGHHDLWTLITGPHDYKSLAGMRLFAERDIRHYVDHLDEIEDPTTLKLLRKNLEAKQTEMKWYDDRSVEEHSREIEAKLEKTREEVKTLENEVKLDKHERRRGAPLAVLAAAGIVGGAMYFASRRHADEDDDLLDDEFSYKPDETAVPV